MLKDGDPGVSERYRFARVEDRPEARLRLIQALACARAVRALASEEKGDSGLLARDPVPELGARPPRARAEKASPATPGRLFCLP